jgi:hypothetical protein
MLNISLLDFNIQKRTAGFRSGDLLKGYPKIFIFGFDVFFLCFKNQVASKSGISPVSKKKFTIYREF